MKKAVIYARVSTKDQEREGFSVPAQLRILRNYAEEKGFKVVQEFTESESAGKAGRSRFGKMVSLLESDRSIEAILVEKTDRLYRNFKDKVVIDELGKDVHFVKDNRVIGKHSKSSDKFVNDIETAQARFYLNNLSEEVKKGQDQKARQGQYPGGPVPLGYVRNPISKTIEIDPVRGPIIRRLFELYADTEHSIDDVYAEAKRLNLVYPKSNRIITRSEIERLLKKSFYSGKFEWHGELYQGDHPALVDPVLFDRVQNAFRRRSNGKFSKHDFTFSRLITCGQCGHTITAEIKKGKYVYYRCTGYGNKHTVEYVRESEIDRMFTTVVGGATLPKEFYEFLKLCLESEQKKQKVHTAIERDRLESARDKIQTDMKKAFQAKIDGLIDDEFFKSVHSEYRKQLDSINYRLKNLTDCIDERFDVALKTIELSHQAESLYLKANADQKRRLLKSMLSNCHLKDGTLYPVYNKAFDIFAKGIASNDKRRGRDSNPG